MTHTVDYLHLPHGAHLVAESLYQRQPATPPQLAERTGLSAPAIHVALQHLGALGVLRGGTPLKDGRAGFVWLDLAPALMEVAA